MRRRCASLSAADSHCIREQSARSTGRVLPRPCYPLLDGSLGLPTARRLCVPFQELFELRKKVKTRQQVRAAPFQTATPHRASTHRCIPVPRSPGEAAPVYTHEAPHRPAAHAALAAGRLKHAANGGSRLTTSAFERPCAVHGSPHVSSTIEMPWFYVVSGAYIEIASVSLYLVTTRYLYNM